MLRATQPLPHSACVDLGDGRIIELRELLAKGASSLVYRAVLEAATGIKRSVAVKIFATVSSEELEQVLMLVAQATERAACIRHPNVAAVYDCGLWQGQPFIIAELVDGVPLSALMERYVKKQRRMPLDLALFLASEIAEGLSGARTARDQEGVQLGVLHLGLSPREVVLSWLGEVKVVDFELSMTRGTTSSVRSLRAVAGRVNTMAPEVAQGAPGDGRADVFSLGVVMRELFIGPRFPAGLTNSEAIRMAREGYVQPICFQPDLPEGLVHVMVRALQVEPDARYPNVSALAFDIRRIALAMGVGDGRYFLRRTLDHEWRDGSDEVTAERTYDMAEAPESGEVVDLLSDDLLDL
jgi:eukaryotic-like serine/threonine-protein kinase